MFVGEDGWWGSTTLAARGFEGTRMLRQVLIAGCGSPPLLSDWSRDSLATGGFKTLSCREPIADVLLQPELCGKSLEARIGPELFERGPHYHHADR